MENQQSPLQNDKIDLFLVLIINLSTFILLYLNYIENPVAFQIILTIPFVLLFIIIIKRKRIPGIVCLSQWRSWKTARDDTRMGSVLKIVWFQDEFALPIDNSIIERIKVVQWEKYARDFDD